MSAWNSCIVGATWLSDALMETLHYAEPLPVQEVVVPTVVRSLLSDTPMDVSLTAPTGSGKTLCYLLPMLRFIAEEKRGTNDTKLRSIILVPTKVLGQQVFRETQQLIRHTTIVATHWCGSGDTSHGHAPKEDLQQLLRRVRVSSKAFHHESARNEADDEEAQDSLAEEEGDEGSHQHDDLSVDDSTCTGFRYYVKADVLITTPQRLLQHLESIDTMNVALLTSLKLIIIDEADQVLGGHFSNAVTKVVEAFEREKDREQYREMSRSMEVVPSAAPHLANGELRRRVGPPILHKILCSATLSSRIARISDIRLRNCLFFVLSSKGKALDDDTSSSPGFQQSHFSFPPTLQEHVVFVEENYRHAALLKLIRTLVDKRRELLRLTEALKEAKENELEASIENAIQLELEDSDPSSPETIKAQKSREARTQTITAKLEALATSYPPVEREAGHRIIVFCNSAEEARVVAHMLHVGGIPGVLEFTTAATERERHHVLLQPKSTSGLESSCIVASDALMRGIDIPAVGHIVMYQLPESLAQLVHRAGRTARAMRPGHVHLLLTKRRNPIPSAPPKPQKDKKKKSVVRSREKESEEIASDDQMASYYRLTSEISRTLPIQFERGFFKFRTLPKVEVEGASSATVEKESVSSVPVAAQSESTVDAKTPEIEKTEDDLPFAPSEAEWWIEEANRCLARSQHQLQRSWKTVMEATASRPAVIEGTVPSSMAPLSTKSMPNANKTDEKGRRENSFGSSRGRGIFSGKPSGGGQHRKRARH